MSSKEVFTFPGKEPDIGSIYFMTKSGEIRTLKNSEYELSDVYLCILGPADSGDNIYIPFYQILYFRIVSAYDTQANYPVMNRIIKSRVTAYMGSVHSFSFSKVSYPHFGTHISAMEITDDKSKVITHYFPLPNVISLEVLPQEKKEANEPT